MNSIIGQVSYPVFVAGIYVFFILASIFSFIVGIGLATRSATMLRFYTFMSKAYSVRRVVKPLTAPHYIEPEVFSHPTLFGVFITLGALVSFIFLYGIDPAVFQPVYFDAFGFRASAMLAFNTWVVLLLGNAGCVALGLIVLFYPKRLSSVESFVDTWFKMHKKNHPLRSVRFEVEPWVLAHPTVSGIILSLMSLGMGITMYAQL